METGWPHVGYPSKMAPSRCTALSYPPHDQSWAGQGGEQARLTPYARAHAGQ